MGKQIPYVDYLVLGSDPHLKANVCKECGSVYFDRRNACAKCGKTVFDSKRLPSEGEVTSFTIVQRAAPGVPTPYVSAVIRLTDGTAVKANVVDVEPDPEHVTLGMKVKLTTYPAAKDDEQTEAVTFGYAPA